LKNHADGPFVRREKNRRRRYNSVADSDLAMIRPLQTRQASKRRALAASARSEQREKLTRLDIKTKILDGIDLSVHGLKRLAQAGYVNSHLFTLPFLSAHAQDESAHDEGQRDQNGNQQDAKRRCGV
jgi:hypothetical protein